MAEKEATIFILDLGASMARVNRNNGRNESDLDWSMRYVWDRITDIVAANRKTLCVGILGLRTDETSNQLQADDGYENISVLQELGQMTMPNLRSLQSHIKVNQTSSGDAISAVVVAVDMIDSFTKKLKYMRRIILVTDGEGELDTDDVDDIANKMNDSKISLTVLGVDFDDAEFGYKEEDKTAVKATNEKALRALVSKCDNGDFATMAAAIDELEMPRIKTVKPYKTYDGLLTLGNPELSPSMSINVERYFKTHLARPLGASTVVVKSEQVASTQSTKTLDDDAMEGVEFCAAKQTRSYKVDDPEAPGGKRDVEFESLAKGYEYGRTAVHISESEHNITKLETQKCFSILGFIPFNSYEPFLSMGEACVTHARAFDERSEIALSSLVWALSELESYAIARLVTKDGKEPQLVLLAPHIDNDIECLYDVPLPFAEDVRAYRFPPLDKVMTVSGQTLTQHRLLPSDELNEAMSDYVDAMDLTEYAKSSGAADHMPMDETFNPAIHRINHAVKTRAAHPDRPISKMPPALLLHSAPPDDLVKRVQERIDALIEAAEVKKVPPKAKGRRNREAVKPISGLDVDALLGDGKNGQVSEENPIPDFKQALAGASDTSSIRPIAKQMGTVVRSLVTNSFGTSKDAQALECLRVMREELTNAEEPGLYNAFVTDFKKSLLSGELGGDRRELWYQMQKPPLGLISKGESEISDVTDEQAKEFFKFR
ncbi:hypothetical protein RJ55_03062 [Drechmeria coniospora]|nr:hypothetical protein RJ55_03062 [Drechmeria coniospora]